MENSEVMLEIELNGAARQVRDGQNVADLIEELSLSGKAVAVAINREIVPRVRGQSASYRRLIVSISCAP